MMLSTDQSVAKVAVLIGIENGDARAGGGADGGGVGSAYNGLSRLFGEGFILKSLFYGKL